MVRSKTSKHTRGFKKQRTTRKQSKQRGGGISLFQVYVFTGKKDPLKEEDKKIVLDTLKGLYEDVTEIVGSDDILKDSIREFVKDKGKHYKQLKTLTGFSISIPDELKSVNMNDDKLTTEEYKIRDKLPYHTFKLVDAPHGLFSEDVAIIALERV